MNIFGLGANESHKDPRTVAHETTLAALYTQGGIDYVSSDIENQRVVGICTAISFIQEREKANGKKYSPDFQYLLQKKIYDLNWNEGSSIFNAHKVGKNQGLLPADLWTHTTEADRDLPYSQYIAKLQSIPDVEVRRLLGLCVDKIPGYAEVNVNNPTAIAKAINDSKAGIICRYTVGKEWFTPSWDPKDINPLRPPSEVISGHAIIMSKFDYTSTIDQILANTWGTQWCKHGTADVIWDVYRPTEAWVVSSKVFFIKDLKLGMTDPDVRRLQQFLNTHGYPVSVSGDGSPGHETEYFGTRTQQALIKFQLGNSIKPALGYFGIITRTIVNAMP